MGNENRFSSTGNANFKSSVTPTDNAEFVSRFPLTGNMYLDDRAPLTGEETTEHPKQDNKREKTKRKTEEEALWHPSFFNTPLVAQWEKKTRTMDPIEYGLYMSHIEITLKYTLERLKCIALVCGIAAVAATTPAIIIKLLKK